jgi:16S rRNA (cytosine967-C5)-methyltransferase
MTPAARLSAAIEVMADIESRRRPASDALKDWGLAHRFAGSGDRAAIAGIAYDALRRKASAAFLMGEDTPRAVLLGMLRLERGMDVGAIARLADGARFAPAPLSEAEQKSLRDGSLAQAPAHIAGDYPEWLDPHLARVFGDERAQEAAALARRAPLDLRVNTLKADRLKTAKSLEHLKVAPTRWSPVGLRITLPPDTKNIAVHSEPAFLGGLIEVQDEGSQLAALMSGAKPDTQVVDLCAGAGGKTLALAALMENRGQIYATDLDKRRLAPIHKRLERAGVRNTQVHTPHGKEDLLAERHGNPDAKWRVRPGALVERAKEQTAVLDRAAPLVRPGGRIVYVTCSVLAEENGDQVRAFVERHPEFAVAPPAELLAPLGERALVFRQAVFMSPEGLQMTPRRTETDGFFVSVLVRSAR